MTELRKEGSPEETITAALKKIEADMAKLMRVVVGDDSEGQPTGGLVTRTTRLEQVVLGDEGIGLSGQLKRIETLEAAVQAIKQEREEARQEAKADRDRQALYMRLIIGGLLATSVGNANSLWEFIQSIFALIS